MAWGSPGIRNLEAIKSFGDYLLMTDGECVLYPYFIRDHLADILYEFNCPRDFGLLCVYVGGFDLPVLSSLEWAKYRPQVVVTEMSEYCPSQSYHTAKFVTAKNYLLKPFDGFNGSFVRA